MNPSEILDALNGAFAPYHVANPAATGDAPSYIPKLIELTVSLLLYVAGIVLIIAIIYGGILYITSAGDEAKATKGRQALLYGVIGTTIVVLSFVMIYIIRSLLSA